MGIRDRLKKPGYMVREEAQRDKLRQNGWKEVAEIRRETKNGQGRKVCD